jgi:hypothetical protein
MPVNVITVTPVIFTDGAGPFGPDELHAPYFPSKETHLVHHGAGTTPRALWYTFLDNIPDGRAFHSIELANLDNDDMNVTVSAQPGVVGRVRLTIYVLAEG